MNQSTGQFAIYQSADGSVATEVKPDEREIMVKEIINLINGKNT